MIKPPLYQGNDFKMVLGGIWFSAPRPTANRSSVLPDETEDRKLFFRFWEYIHGLTKVAQLGLFFKGSNPSTFFRKSGSRLQCGLHDFFFFSLSDSLYFSRFIMSSIDSDCWEILFFKFQAFTSAFQTLKTQTEIQAFSRISSNCHKPCVIRESLNGTNCSFAN